MPDFLPKMYPLLNRYQLDEKEIDWWNTQCFQKSFLDVLNTFLFPQS